VKFPPFIWFFGTILLSLLFRAQTGAHPIPDIPVRGTFNASGQATLTVLVDPRCFDADPATATSLTRILFQNLTNERKRELLEMAETLVRRDIEFYVQPLGQIQPKFIFEFTGERQRPLEKDEDVIILAGKWSTTLPSGVTGWNIRSGKQNKVSVVFENDIDGTPHPRVAVLFPGEQSYTLDLTQLSSAPQSEPPPHSVPAFGGSGHLASTLWSFCKQGFGHVIPEGLDHALFVLGLFLLGRSWRPLLFQMSIFTLAHTVTLTLVTLGQVSPAPKIIQPLIAATIAFVAIENLWKARYTHGRLFVVFAFGLIHGMGFASALDQSSIPKGSVIAAIGGFNLGIETGQLSVLLLAVLLTGWIQKPDQFRRWITIPGSIGIGLVGVVWTLERLYH
jgi:hypothetical protein